MPVFRQIAEEFQKEHLFVFSRYKSEEIELSNLLKMLGY